MIYINRDTIEITSFACPSQWNAKTFENEYVYIRVRHGYFSLEVNGEKIFDGYPEGVDGVMDTSEMIDFVNSNTSKIRIE